jgi:hypothetical protein
MSVRFASGVAVRVERLLCYLPSAVGRLKISCGAKKTQTRFLEQTGFLEWKDDSKREVIFISNPNGDIHI